MQEVIDTIVQQLRDKIVGIVIAAVFAAAGWYLGKRRARADWRRKEFFDRLNVSLNIIRDGTLQIRTILEKSCAEVFLNSVATDTIITQSRLTTERDPIIPLPKGEYWYYLNSVLNDVAEKFALGQVKRDLGLPTNSERYLLCLTNECSGEMKTRKLRAMLIQKKLLINLPTETPKLENPHHATRWNTLKQLAAEYQQNAHKFLDIEIVV